jgi:proteasome-associated ATPase
MSMPRITRNETSASAPPISPPIVERLTATGEDAPSLDDKVELAQAVRRECSDGGRQLDRLLLDRIARATLGLEEAKARQLELRAIHAKLTASPWYPAVFLRPLVTPLGTRAMVMCEGSKRVVEVAEELDVSSLLAGAEVLLGQDRNVVLVVSPDGYARHGETGFFDRRLDDGRFVIRWRDEDVIVDPAALLGGAVLSRGDQLRWDRGTGMAFEKIDAGEGRRFLVDEIPVVTRDQVGGQDENLETILSALTVTLVDPAGAARYGLGNRQSIILVGPPGNGKTLLARVAAAEIARLTGKRCFFAVVKPAEWESPWVGETEQNIRNCFRALREAAADGFAVLFLDEIEAVGRIRGNVVGHHSDKFLAALLAELDGFNDRSGVAIIAATNRKDLIDQALLERLSDIEIQVRRPDMRGARSIFAIHLPPSLCYATSRSTGSDVRLEMIECAVSRLYAPNADNELCVLHFRDGTTRTVVARDLASGRTFEQICRAARRTAFLRETRGGEPGLCVADIEEAVSQALERLASSLGPRSAHAHLSDLPQDLDVVRVEPLVRRVARPRHYLNAA